MDQLTMIFGDRLSQDERRRILRSIFRGLGGMAADCVEVFRHSPARTRAFISNDPGPIRIFEQMLERGRGLILITAHLGGWELAAPYVASYFPNRGALVVARLHNSYMQELSHNFRSRMGCRIFYREETPRKLLRHLQGGGILGMLPDMDIHTIRGIFVPFLGRNAYTPTGPASLSVLAQCPILPLVLVRGLEGGYRLEVAEPVEPRPQADTKEEVLRITRAWSESIERFVLRYPDQWMWFHPRWHTTPERLRLRREHRLRQFRESSSASQTEFPK